MAHHPRARFVSLGVAIAMILSIAAPFKASGDSTGSSTARSQPKPNSTQHVSAASSVIRTATASNQNPSVADNATGGAPAGGASGGQAGLTPEQLKALAKLTQNPVGNVAILPFQNNWNYKAGQTGTTVWNMNIQPVVPIMLSPKANLIERAIVPVINVPPLLDARHCRTASVAVGDLNVLQQVPCAAQLGFGNIQLQNYYAPKRNPNGFQYGVGPIFSFPTVTKDLGTQQWGAGINAVGLVMPGPWVVGMLVNQRWYVAGPSTSPQNTLNSFLAQPFINYNFGRGWALTEAPVITANWNKPGDQKWTVPIGLGISNTNTWLKLPMSYQLAYYGNIVRPTYAPYGIIRFQWAIIWPVKRGLTMPGM